MYRTNWNTCPCHGSKKISRNDRKARKAWPSLSHTSFPITFGKKFCMLETILAKPFSNDNYFGGARSKGFATLRNVSKLTFFDKIGHAKSVGFRFYSAIWRSESRISSRYFEITSISLIYSLFFSRNKELLFWPSRGLNRLTCVTRQIRDSKLRD